MAAVDYFLKIEGITGESQDSKHKGEIELMSFSWGASSNAHVATGGRAGGRISFEDFEFTKLFDKASPQIFLKLVSGFSIPSVTLSARNTSDSEVPNPDFMKVVFTNVLISFYKEHEPNTDLHTSEAVGALFQKMSLTFLSTNPKTGAADIAPITVNAEAASDQG